VLIVEGVVNPMVGPNRGQLEGKGEKQTDLLDAIHGDVVVWRRESSREKRGREKLV